MRLKQYVNTIQRYKTGNVSDVVTAGWSVQGGAAGFMISGDGRPCEFSGMESSRAEASNFLPYMNYTCITILYGVCFLLVRVLWGEVRQPVNIDEAFRDCVTSYRSWGRLADYHYNTQPDLPGW
jgi:hypothetical protein